MNEKKKESSLLLLVCVFYTIYATDSMLFATNNNVTVLNLGKALLVLSVVVTAYSFFSKRNRCIYGYGNNSLILVTWIFLTFATLIVNFDTSQRTFVKVLILTSSFFIAKQISLNDYAKAYCKILNIIGIFSCVMFLFHDYFRTASYLPTITNTNGYTFRSALFANIAESTLDVMHRNIGPFWEPGAYQAYLILGIIFSLFLDFRTSERIRNVIIYIISLIFTYSTTGYVALIPLITAYLLTSKRISNRWVKLILASVCILAVYYILKNEEAYSLVFGKIFEQNDSYVSRVGSIQNGIEVAMKNPIFGVGPVEFESLLDGIAIVNTTVMHFAIYGVGVGLIYLYCMYRFSKSCVNNIISAFFVLGALLLSTSGENLTYSLLFNLILFLKPHYEIGTDESELMIRNR